jgi:hypothetical protein
VSLSGRESAPAFYEVKPWIDLIQPVRGITGIPLSIPLEIPTGAIIGVEIDEQAATVTVDPINKVIHAIVPAIGNGRKAVVVTVNGQRSNTRFYEVLPAITSVTVELSSAPAPPKTTITVLGERLDGTEVYVKYGALLIKKGDISTATQVVVEIGRHLPAHQAVSVIVDGLESNPITA